MRHPDSQLLLLQKIELEKEQSCAMAMQSAASFLNANEAKLKEVQDYKLEYLKKLKEKGESGVGGDSYAHYHRFIVQLDLGIEAQAQVVATAKEVIDQRRMEWLEQKNKVKAVNTLLEKKQQARHKKLEKAEQNQIDEFASQQFIRSRIESSNLV